MNIYLFLPVFTKRAKTRSVWDFLPSKNSKLTEKEPIWNFQQFKIFLSFLKFSKNSKVGQNEPNWNFLHIRNSKSGKFEVELKVKQKFKTQPKTTKIV
jgi:hypothetical protein